MKFEVGTLIVIGAVLLFYLRLITLQFGRVRQARYKAAMALKKKNKKTSAAMDDSKPDTMSLESFGESGALVFRCGEGSKIEEAALVKETPEQKVVLQRFRIVRQVGHRFLGVRQSAL